MKNRKLRIIQLVLTLFTITTTILILTAAATYAYFANEMQSAEKLMNRTNTGLILLDDTGEPFFTFYDAKATEYVDLKNISSHVISALIAAEDKEYYQHNGFSIKGIARAAYRDLMNLGVQEGGSTITQGLIKNALLSPDRNFYRKFQEVVLAIEINRKYNKDKIIEMYLNSAYFGEGAFGIYDAARTYFGVHSKDLTLAQSAFLIGLLPAPSALSPISNDASEAIKRQHIVLSEMLADKKISQEEYNNALAENMAFKGNMYPLNNKAPLFAIYVRDELLKEFGEERILRSGFRVKTTLNMQWQEYAENIVKQQVERLKPNKATNGAAVVLNAKTGQIKVMVGSHDWFDDKNGKINMAISPRQPGSAIKPIFYAAALDKRIITPATLLKDLPKRYPGGYTPRNYDGNFRGLVVPRRALANSLNLPAVDMLDRLSIQSGIEIGKSFGLSTFNTENAQNFGLSMVLGSPEIPLLEMASAYRVFADQGIYLPATPLLEIRDKFGNEIQFFQPQKTRAISSESAFIISSILSDNGARAEIFGNALTINKIAAVKTGTSEFYRDALTLGYTPSIVVGVWVGNNDNTAMDRVAGSLGAAPIWKSLITEFTKDQLNEKFDVPDGIVRSKVCFITNPFKKNEKRDKEQKPRLILYDEYYIKGTEKSGCNIDIKAFEAQKGKEEG